MKKHEIIKGRSYTNASGRAERQVLDIGKNLPIIWFGDDATEPKGEDVVCYVDTRMGKTFYGPRSGKRPASMYISAFAAWAKNLVPEGKEA